MTESTIDMAAVRTRIQTAKDEMIAIHKERSEIVDGMWVSLVANQHFLMIGPGGTGKSFIVRDLSGRIVGAKYFEKALDETSTPDEVLGPPDIKAMVEDGKTRRVVTGMLPEADIAFIDEFFNANGPTLHNTMPLLNERIHHNNGVPSRIPLKSCFMGSNKLNADAEMAAVWDRVHHRHKITYVEDRDALRDLITEAVLRRSGVLTEPTTLDLKELDAAHKASLQIPVPDATYGVFLDIVENLRRQGVVVSTRRVVEGMAAVLAAAWLNGNEAGVRVGDMSVLRHMFWSVQDDIGKVREVVLNATNPGEKKALDLREDLEKLKGEYQTVSELDAVKRNAAAIDIFKKVDRCFNEALPLIKQAEEIGAPARRIQEVIDFAKELKVKIGTECFGLTKEQVERMNNR